jgi:nucleotide-binding universal stress UspA family protein
MSNGIRAIVVGVSDLDDDPVLVPAVRLAERLGAELHAVHAFEMPPAVLRTHMAAGAPERRVREMIERQLTERLEAQLRRIAPETAAELRLTIGPAGDTLVSVASKVRANLILVGATRQGPMIRHLLGSTADRVIRTSTVPVLVLRPPFASEFRRVLLTTDRTTLSEDALGAAGRLVAELAGAGTPEVRCLEVTWVSEWIRPALQPQQLLREGRAQLDRFLASVELPFPAVTPRVRVGDPAKEIVAEAADWSADLVVVGTRGRAGVSRFLLGSVAGSVLRSALCDVLVLPVTGGAVAPRPAERPTGTGPA